MKNTILFLALVAIGFTACNSNPLTESTSDSTVVDSTIVDSAAVATDSTALTGDSTTAKITPELSK